MDLPERGQAMHPGSLHSDLQNDDEDDSQLEGEDGNCSGGEAASLQLVLVRGAYMKVQAAVARRWLAAQCSSSREPGLAHT